MSTTIKNEEELKNLLVTMMVKATSDLKSAGQTFEEKAKYSFKLKHRDPDSSFVVPYSYTDTHILTIKVKAFGSPNPITLDKYIEDFHYADTHFSTINTEKEVITTDNFTTMRCHIFISLKAYDPYSQINLI